MRALGDDESDLSDDDDGIIFTSALVPGSACTIEVIASGPGRLDAWIDFGVDGSWSDVQDRIFDHQDVLAGVNQLSFLVPDDAQLGVTFARFRYSKGGVATFTGPAADGEVEDYEVVIEALDWGDAPDVSNRSLVTRLGSFAPQAGEFFGTSVAIDRTWAMVGAPASDVGTVYMYHWDGTWMPFDYLEPSDPLNGNHQFGISVALSDDWAVVGSLWGDEARSEAGAAYVFHWDGTSWTETQKLTNEVRKSWFGSTIEVAGDRMVVGARGNESVYVYKQVAMEWQLEQQLMPGDGMPLDSFGSELSISGDWIFVGAPAHQLGDIDYAGAVYAFRWNGTEWLEEQKLVPAEPYHKTSFGTAVSLFGDRAVISEPGRAVNVLALEAGVWREQQRLEQPGDGHFGRDVELAGNQIVIGGDTDAYVFGWDGTQWRPVEQISVGIAHDPYRPSVTVAVENTEVMIGARFDDHLGLIDSGGAYIVRRGVPAETHYATLFVNNGARHAFAPGMYLGEKVDIEANGLPDEFAVGDDSHHGADEDGVLLSRLVRNTTSYATMTASAAGYLNAWMDFNRDGDWDDDGEQIFAGESLIAGINTLAFQVPDAAVDDLKFPAISRFRFSSVEILPYDGPAPDGEVEDHAVWIVPDTDADGVADEEENAGPNNGDGNYDGLPDSAQTNVGSLFFPGTSGYVTIIAPEGTDP